MNQRIKQAAMEILGSRMAPSEQAERLGNLYHAVEDDQRRSLFGFVVAALMTSRTVAEFEARI